MEQTFITLIGEFGYLGIFAAMALGIIGLPFPDEILMTFVGYMVQQGLLSYEMSLLSACLGAICGVSISYFLGMRLGLPFLRKVGPYIFITAAKIEKSQLLFQKKYGFFIIFVSYYVTGLRHIAAYLAGISRMNFRNYMLVAYTGASLWCFTFYHCGKNTWKTLEADAGIYGPPRDFFIPVMIVCLLVIILVFIIVKRKKIEARKKIKTLMNPGWNDIRTIESEAGSLLECQSPDRRAGSLFDFERKGKKKQRLSHDFLQPCQILDNVDSAAKQRIMSRVCTRIRAVYSQSVASHGFDLFPGKVLCGFTAKPGPKNGYSRIGRTGYPVAVPAEPEQHDVPLFDGKIAVLPQFNLVL